MVGAQGLPPPAGAPLAIDFSRDPVLALARGEASWPMLRAAVNGAIDRQPGIGEYAATEDEARAAVRQAREQQLPSADLTLSSYRVISRDFSNDPENIIERSRPSRRTDALAAVNQTLFDFGAGESRVRAASARLRGAAADVENAADRIALNTVAAWYDLFGYRALIELSRAFEIGLERPARARCGNASGRARRPKAILLWSIPRSRESRRGSPNSAASSPMRRRATPR